MHMSYNNIENNWKTCTMMNVYYFKLEARGGGYLEIPQAGQEATNTDKPITKCSKNMSEAGNRCMCLNPRRIINKKNELNIMVEDY